VLYLLAHCLIYGVHYIVHGHEQCVVCKTNVEPCCQGQVLKGGRDE